MVTTSQAQRVSKVIIRNQFRGGQQRSHRVTVSAHLLTLSTDFIFQLSAVNMKELP
jgi:hypothetical protein